MKKGNLFLCLMILMVSCGTQPREEAVIRPVKVEPILELGSIEKSFSGVVIPDQYSDLAFKVGGPLIELNVVEGQNVKKGDVIARIDPFDYNLKYEAAKASFITVKSQLERAEKLIAKNAISRQDYESTQANFENANAQFENAKDLLESTKLKAPFSGFILTKYVENYQKVQQGTPIVSLIDPTLLEVKFVMPETNMELFLDQPNIYVEFENYKDVQFKAEVKEYIQASPDGSGFPVFLKITDSRFNLKDYNISVGFTCKITFDYQNEKLTNFYKVPLSAIVTVTDSDVKHVFIYNKEAGTVNLRSVKDSGVAGRDNVIISQGVKAGELVVVAGCHRLVNGQKVKVLTK